MWLTNLKIAIIEKNTDRLNELMDDIPQLEEKKDIEEALYLIKQASELVYSLQDKTAISMKQMKKNIDFLKSTEPQKQGKFDIKS